MPDPSWVLLSNEQAAEAERLGVAAAYEDTKTGLRFVLIPAVGTMRAFYAATTEVMNRHYELWDPDHERTFHGPDDPVECVSVADAIGFARWMSSGAQHGCRYRLPSEREWDHACRAGSMTSYAFGDSLTDEQANFIDPQSLRRNGRATALPCASFAPNAWGLFDMHGNVGELCVPPAAGVVRGGGWRSGAEAVRSDARVVVFTERDPDFGFRVVRFALPD